MKLTSQFDCGVLEGVNPPGENSDTSDFDENKT